MQDYKRISRVDEWLQQCTGIQFEQQISDDDKSDQLDSDQSYIKCDVDEQPLDNYKRHNPYRHIRFATEDARKLTREFGIREHCRQYFPPEPYVQIAEQALSDVIDAMDYIKLSAFNPIKLFAYCFVIRSQIQSKRALELLNMPQTKSGKQFSILSKGRQIYQQYEYAKTNAGVQQEICVNNSLNTVDVNAAIVKQELIDMHVCHEIFAHCTIDAINKVTEILTQRDPGVVRCQKRYKMIIKKIQELPGNNYVNARLLASKLVVQLRNRTSKQ